MAAMIEKRRTVHGGADSALSVEVMPLRDHPRGFDPCPEDWKGADLYGVYVRNPLALHIADHRPAVRPDSSAPPANKARSLEQARVRAFGQALAIAEHLGCAMNAPGFDL